AGVVRDEERELVHVPVDQLLEAEHYPRSRERRSLRPAGKGLLRHGDRALGLGLGGERNPARERPGRRVEHVAEAAAFTADLPAADEMGEFANLGECGVTGIHRRSLNYSGRSSTA